MLLQIWYKCKKIPGNAFICISGNFYAGSRGRTDTRFKSNGILSPARLPIPPCRQAASDDSLFPYFGSLCIRIYRIRTAVLFIPDDPVSWILGDSNPGPTGYEPVALTNWAKDPYKKRMRQKPVICRIQNASSRARTCNTAANSRVLYHWAIKAYINHYRTIWLYRLRSLKRASLFYTYHSASIIVHTFKTE